MNDIRAMIRERGLKQENVARALQITTNTLNKKLNGETEFRLCEAKTLAALLDTSVDALQKAAPDKVQLVWIFASGIIKA